MFTYSGMISNVEGAGSPAVWWNYYSAFKNWHMQRLLCFQLKFFQRCIVCSLQEWVKLISVVMWTAWGRILNQLTLLMVWFLHMLALIHCKNLAAHHGFDFKESLLYNTFPNVSKVLRLHVPNFTKLICNCKTRNDLGCKENEEIHTYSVSSFPLELVLGQQHSTEHPIYWRVKW